MSIGRLSRSLILFLWSSAPLTAEAQALAGERAAPALEERYGGVVYYPDAEGRLSRLGKRLYAANPKFDCPCRLSPAGLGPAQRVLPAGTGLSDPGPVSDLENGRLPRGSTGTRVGAPGT